MLILGTLGLVAVVAVTAWSVRTGPKGPTSVSGPGPANTDVGTSSRSETKLSSLPSEDPATVPVAREVPAAKAPEEVPAADSMVEPPPAPDVVPAEPPKPSSLDPILGGRDMIRGRYASSTYEERASRVATLETVLGTGEPEDKDQADSYAALKDELAWLRENLGTPPPPAPK